VRDFGWSRTQVTSGNALSKLGVGPLFGFVAGWLVDRFGPRRLMLAGILMAGVALIGLGRMTAWWMFYLFYLLNALGYVCGGPLPNQVLLSRWFEAARGRAMGFAYLGIGVGGALVPLVSASLVAAFGWRIALQVLGLLIIVLALPFAYAVRESPGVEDARLKGSRSDERAERPTGRSPTYCGVLLRTTGFYVLSVRDGWSASARRDSAVDHRVSAGSAGFSEDSRNAATFFRSSS